MVVIKGYRIVELGAQRYEYFFNGQGVSEVK